DGTRLDGARAVVVRILAQRLDLPRDAEVAPEAPEELRALAPQQLLDPLHGALKLGWGQVERLADRRIVAAVVAEKVDLLQQRLPAQDLDRGAHPAFGLPDVVREQLPVTVVGCGRRSGVARQRDEEVPHPG